MTRSGDLAIPTVVPHPLPPGAPVADWRAQLRIAIDILPQSAYTWDDTDLDVTWDDTTPQRIWDAPLIGGGLSDVICDFQALTISAGHVDDLGLFAAGSIVLNLDNRSGAYSQYAADGRLVYFAPGRSVYVFARLDGVNWWLFSGLVTAWVENSDDTVTVEAVDGFNWLARPIGEFTPGAAGNAPLTRVRALATAADFPWRVIGDAGNVTLTAQLTDRSPLEEMQVVALSDGGLVHCDADGSLIYRDRLWTSGRLDQTRIDVFSDNVCAVPNIVWEPQMVSADDGLANWIRLANVAGITVTATDTTPTLGIRYSLTHSEPDQWTDAGEGQALANTLLQQKKTPTLRVGGFQMHLLDPNQDLWLEALDRRLGDKIEWIHDFHAADGSTGTVDVFVIVTTIDHEITPETWITTIGTSRAFSYVALEYWDKTRFLWDSTSPSAVWRY